MTAVFIKGVDGIKGTCSVLFCLELVLTEMNDPKSSIAKLFIVIYVHKRSAYFPTVEPKIYEKMKISDQFQ